MSLKEVGKKAAAESAINNYVKNGQKIGIGSGSTIVYAIESLAKRVETENLSILCAPTSFQARALILEHKLPLISLEEHTELDVAFDGADEVDKNLCLIKGGGGCHLQEKIIAYAAKQLIIIADDSKDSVFLGDNWKNGVPIEVVPLAYQIVKNRIESELGGKVALRKAIKKMGPIVTDNGNFILDWQITSGPISELQDWINIDTKLHMIPGVVESGLFIGMATEAFFGRGDGSVYSRRPVQVQC